MLEIEKFIIHIFAEIFVYNTSIVVSDEYVSNKKASKIIVKYIFMLTNIIMFELIVNELSVFFGYGKICINMDHFLVEAYLSLHVYFDFAN